jgi:hypothetical protein
VEGLVAVLRVRTASHRIRRSAVLGRPWAEGEEMKSLLRVIVLAVSLGHQSSGISAPTAVWLELADCVETTSIDGKKSLSLLDNGVANIRENKSSVKRTGTWTCDKERDRITIIIDDSRICT